MGGFVSSLSGKLLVSGRSHFFCGQESNSPTFKHEEKKGDEERGAQKSGIEKWSGI